ncbi:MAG TPA: hypothetical protein VMA73_18610, partial [Streptosporangiaceae bacterium]|nr:hypothetical protein [Streptosporangiaceae bacterium]
KRAEGRVESTTGESTLTPYYPSGNTGGDEISGQAAAAVESVVAWMYQRLMQSHPELGRNGAVCPYLELAVAEGRHCISLIRIDTPDDSQRLADAVLAWLPRISGAADKARGQESVIFVPVGADTPVLAAVIGHVQRDLRSDAIHAGRMIGDFLPGHDAPGVHNAAFRPLESPWPVLGIRTMVETDILFLRSSDIPAIDRGSYIDVWRRFFGQSAGKRFMNVYENCRMELDAM